MLVQKLSGMEGREDSQEEGKPAKRERKKGWGVTGMVKRFYD